MIGPRLLDLYLLRRYLLCLSLSILSLVLIAVIIDLTENIDTFIDFDARPSRILLYYLYHTPYWVVLILPIATLLGTLFALTSLARHSEIMAMKAVGISLYRMLMPIFLFALCFSGLAFLFTDRIVPDATYRFNTIHDEITSYSRTDGSRRHVLLQDVGGQLLFARTYDSGRRKAREVSWEWRPAGRVVERITARTMEWDQDRWLLHQGRHYRFAEPARQPVAFDTLSLPMLTILPDDFARQHKKPEEMRYAELARYIERAIAKGEDATRHRVDLYLKISFPFTCFIIVLLGAPLGANARRAGLANSFGLGILICFVFYSCVKAGQALGWNKVLIPWIGAWAANILFASLSAILLWRTHKSKAAGTPPGRGLPEDNRKANRHETRDWEFPGRMCRDVSCPVPAACGRFSA